MAFCIKPNISAAISKKIGIISNCDQSQRDFAGCFSSVILIFLSGEEVGSDVSVIIDFLIYSLNPSGGSYLYARRMSTIIPILSKTARSMSNETYHQENLIN